MIQSMKKGTALPVTHDASDFTCSCLGLKQFELGFHRFNIIFRFVYLFLEFFFQDRSVFGIGKETNAFPKVDIPSSLRSCW